MYEIFSGHALTGARGVRDCARLIARFHYIEAQLMRTGAGMLARQPEWEAKCLVGRHLWEDSLHGDALLRRMAELRWPRTAPLHPGEGTVRLMSMLDDAPDTAAFLTAVYAVVKPALASAYAAYLEDGPSIADDPSHVVLEALLLEEQRQIAEGVRLIASLGPPHEPERLRDWETQIREASSVAGDLSRPDAAIERELSGSFEGQTTTPAPAIAARDARFRLTDDALESPGSGAPSAAFMAHRDADNEMHAAEVLGRNIYEHPEMPWDYHVDMARQCWDEVRHALLYQRYLEQLGGRLGEYPVVAGNYAYRMQLDLPHRLYDLHLRGEKLGMPDLIRFREEAAERGDRAYELLNDFVHADEVPHVRNGRWLTWMLGDDQEAWERVERETMQRRAAYESEHGDDPLLARYTGLAL